MSGIPKCLIVRTDAACTAKRNNPTIWNTDFRVICFLCLQEHDPRCKMDLIASTKKTMKQHRQLSLHPRLASLAVLKSHERMSGDERLKSFLDRSSFPACMTPFCCQDATSSFHGCIFFPFGKSEGSCLDECVGVCRSRPLVASNPSAFCSSFYGLIYTTNGSIIISISHSNLFLAIVRVGLEEMIS